MSVVAVVLISGLSLASFGVALWTWWALHSVADLQLELDRRHFEVR
jgi:hypothetical protein